MPVPRRLVATLTALALGWSVLVLGLEAPAARAAEGAGEAQRAPHDPTTYYAGTEGLSGAALALELNSIIDDQTRLTYAEVYDALPTTDEDPADPLNLIVFYSGTSLRKTARCGSGSCAGLWNREHTWPQSHGSIGTAGPGADLHHMRPEFADTNSSRGNKDFADGGTAGVPSCAACRSTADTFEPRAAVKGDLARGILYMAVRYNGDADDGFAGDLEPAEVVPTSGPRLGRLSTLVAWSLADPPDAAERARNDLVDSTYQHNRNPFIDHPEWVCSIWGVPGGSGCAAPVNTAPTTAPTSATTPEDTAATVPLRATDADGDPLTWTATGAPSLGSATVSGATLTYVPRPDVHGTDQVGVTVSDGRGGTVPTTVTVSVTAVNDAPVAPSLAATTLRGTATQVQLTGSDVDHDTAELEHQVATPPTHGTVELVGTTATYTPAAGWTGTDSFTYEVRDAAGAVSAPGTVSVTVTAPPQQGPTATPLTATTAEDGAVTFALTATDPDGDPITYAVVRQPAHGSVSLAGDQATYTPVADFHGPDSFEFTASDGPRTSARATATLTVTPVGDAPVARGRAASASEDGRVVVPLEATDADGDALTYAGGADALHGTVVVTGSTATYTPDPGWSGTDAFTYTASDGVLTSSPATVTVTVAAVNDPPVASATEVAATAGTPVTVTLDDLAASDPDGEPVRISAATAYGTGTVTHDDESLTYTPASRLGDHAVVVTVTDPQGATATVWVLLSVSARVAQVGLTTSPATRGAPTTTTVAVTGPSGPVPTGVVTLRRADGAVLGTAALDAAGSGVVAWVPGRAGPTPLEAAYAGDALFAPTTSPTVTGTVARSASRLTVSAGPLRRGRPAVVRATVRTVAGAAATGRVVVTLGDRRLTATLTRGTATFRVARLPRAATVRLVARYAGDTQYVPGSTTRTLRLRR